MFFSFSNQENLYKIGAFCTISLDLGKNVVINIFIEIKLKFINLYSKI